VTLRVIQPGERFDLGPFGVTFVPVSHSIPEGNAILIETPYGRVLHTGDWKLDEAPVLGAPATAETLGAIGDKGVLALVCDSTNVFNAEASGSEESVRQGLHDVVAAAKGRVLVTTFASNAARLKTLGEVARATGRKLCLAGRSLDRILRVAQATGYLKDFPKLVDFDAAMALPRHEVMIVATGGQGEPRAALSRIAEGTHPIQLDEGDRVVFSSKQIPGNELAIGRIMNQLAAKGVETVTERQAHIHVSGHPGRPELAQMYRWIRPELLVPVHGEMRHLKEHARFGLAEGIPQALVQTDGDIVRLAPGTPEKIGHAGVGRLVLDGDVILAADGATINERRKLGANGQISVAVALSGGALFGEPQLRLQGVPIEEDRAAFLDEAVEAVEAAVRDDRRGGEALREAIRLAVRHVATRWTGKKPIVDVLIVEG
jgi:ribonuclease J